MNLVLSAPAVIAALAVCGLSAWTTAQQPDACSQLHPEHCGACGKALALQRRLAAGLPVTDEALLLPAEALGATDLLHVDLDIEVFPATTSLAGTCSLTLRSLTAGLTEFTFRLRNNFTITSATINGTAVSVATLSTTTRRATLDRAYNAGETFTLTIVYDGPAVSRGFGSIDYSVVDGNPVVATLSEAFYAYTWWPSKEGDVGEAGDMADKATFNMAITAPAELTSVSNGALQGVDVLPGNRRRFRWATAYPQAVYLASFGSSVYNHWARSFTLPGGDTMPVEFYIFPGSDTPANRAGWEVCLGALNVFGELYGTYPFASEKYGIYQFLFPGGMEHQTITGQGSFADWVTVHELAHQWWGDNVTCRTWHDIWLNEGFATYSEALWEEHKPGSSGLPALHAAMNGRRPAAVSGSVYRYDVSSNGPIFSGTYSYNKAAWVLHMLRKAVGDAAFFQTFQQYRDAFQNSAATTDDFASVASAVAGRDLTGFFQQWVYAGGAPAYAFGFQPIAVNGRTYLKLHVRQMQSNTFGIDGLFTMPLDVRVNTPSGSVTRTVNDNALLDHFVLPTGGPASGVALDEFNWVLATDKVQETYVAGPPVIVQTAPAPGTAVAAVDAPSALDVFFSDPVVTTAAQCTLTGPAGAVPFTLTYSGALQRARLALDAPLSPGAYTLSIAGGITAQADGAALDGEVVAAQLPSGDGAAGGAALITFTIQQPACAADFNADGNLDPDDLSDFITCFFLDVQFPGACAGADFNHDGFRDPDDLSDFITLFFLGC